MVPEEDSGGERKPIKQFKESKKCGIEWLNLIQKKFHKIELIFANAKKIGMNGFWFYN